MTHEEEVLVIGRIIGYEDEVRRLKGQLDGLRGEIYVSSEARPKQPVCSCEPKLAYPPDSARHQVARRCPDGVERSMGQAGYLLDFAPYVVGCVFYVLVRAMFGLQQILVPSVLPVVVTINLWHVKGNNRKYREMVSRRRRKRSEVESKITATLGKLQDARNKLDNLYDSSELVPKRFRNREALEAIYKMMLASHLSAYEAINLYQQDLQRGLDEQ